MKRKVIAASVAALAAALAVSGCSDSSTRKDAQVANDQLGQYLAAQPVPVFQWSQERSTLIALENARATTTATTTFFFNLGVKAPVASCPSIGFPLASTTQLTNPEQEIGGQGATVGQIDPTGVFTGQSSGTYVVCVDPSGVKYATYWEGDTFTIGGVGTWNAETGAVSLVGKPTVEVATK